MSRIPTYRINGLPVLPEGLHWNLSYRRGSEAPLRLSITEGRVSKFGYSGLSAEIVGADVTEAWHWLVRFKARRLYRRNFKNGELIQRPKKPFERFEDRYSPVAVHRSLEETK